MTKEDRCEKRQSLRTVLTIVQSCLIVILIVLVAIMMVQINRLQGTARVINYAGLVRGATQRLVKLEITEHPDEELESYLDEILTDLKHGAGEYNLVILDDEAYQKKLDELMSYWGSLKEQIETIRANGYEPDSMEELLDMSEIYFTLADETVSAAELYSEEIAKWIRIIEILSAMDMCVLFGIIVEQTASAMRMRRKNIVLEQKAYIDIHTGLQNKNMCEELLGNKAPIEEQTACIMFDINNLKNTNDTYGHLVGDKLIADFAGALKSVVREKDFAGRCGGDEFILMLYGIEESTVWNVLRRLQEEVERINRLEDSVPISYAQGWALSGDYPRCTFRMLFNEADRCMYMNKQKMKEEIAVTEDSNH